MNHNSSTSRNVINERLTNDELFFNFDQRPNALLCKTPNIQFHIEHVEVSLVKCQKCIDWAYEPMLPSIYPVTLNDALQIEMIIMWFPINVLLLITCTLTFYLQNLLLYPKCWGLSSGHQFLSRGGRRILLRKLNTNRNTEW